MSRRGQASRVRTYFGGSGWGSVSVVRGRRTVCAFVAGRVATGAAACGRVTMVGRVVVTPDGRTGRTVVPGTGCWVDGAVVTGLVGRTIVPGTGCWGVGVGVVGLITGGCRGGT